MFELYTLREFLISSCSANKDEKNLKKNVRDICFHVHTSNRVEFKPHIIMYVDINTDQTRKKVIKTQCMLAEKAEESLHLLVREIAGIRSVKQWAESCYVSRSGLKKRMNVVYGRYPKSILREIRFETICLLISEKGRMAASIDVALESGLGPSSDALYKFLSRNFNTTFTDLKSEILIGKRTITFEWLNENDQPN